MHATHFGKSDAPINTRRIPRLQEHKEIEMLALYEQRFSENVSQISERGTASVPLWGHIHIKGGNIPFDCI